MQAGEADAASRAARYPRRPLILFAAMMAMFMSAVESTIVATAMPSIVADLSGFHLFSWVFAGYLLAQAVTVPIYGRLADLYGRKRVFFVGVGIFLFGSLMCGFVRSMPLLIAFRMVQGMGGGSIQSIATTIVGDIYTPMERGRIQAYLSGTYGTAALVGPVLGAFIVEHLHWSFIFWVNLPVGVLVVVLLSLFLNEKVERRPHQIDYLGSVLLALGVGTLMFTLVQSSDLSATWITLLLATSFVTLTGFAFYQQRVPEPVMPLKLLRNRIILISTLVGFNIGAIMMCMVAFVPTYVQGAMGRNPTTSGIVIAVAQVMWWVGTMLAGRIIVRTSYRLVTALGGVCLMAGTGVLSTLQPEQSLFWISAAMLCVGIGLGLANTSVTVSIQSAVGWGERGVVTSTMYFVRMAGMSLGTAMYGGIFNFGLGEAVKSDAVNQLIHPGARYAVPTVQAQALAEAIAGALHNVYLLATGFAVMVLVLGYFIPASLRPTQHAPD